jgi:hypothetical protein
MLAASNYVDWLSMYIDWLLKFSQKSIKVDLTCMGKYLLESKNKNSGGEKVSLTVERYFVGYEQGYPS